MCLSSFELEALRWISASIVPYSRAMFSTSCPFNAVARSGSVSFISRQTATTVLLCNSMNQSHRLPRVVPPAPSRDATNLALLLPLLTLQVQFKELVPAVNFLFVSSTFSTRHVYEISDTTHSHRHVVSHSCNSLTVQKHDTKHDAARAILSEKLGTPSSHTPVVVHQQRKLPPGSQKLAQLQKVNLMKLRHKAVPADPKDSGSAVPIDQRLHVTARVEISGQSTKESALWFRKVIWFRTKFVV